MSVGVIYDLFYNKGPDPAMDKPMKDCYLPDETYVRCAQLNSKYVFRDNKFVKAEEDIPEDRFTHVSCMDLAICLERRNIFMPVGCESVPRVTPTFPSCVLKYFGYKRENNI